MKLNLVDDLLERQDLEISIEATRELERRLEMALTTLENFLILQHHGAVLDYDVKNVNLIIAGLANRPL